MKTNRVRKKINRKGNNNEAESNVGRKTEHGARGEAGGDASGHK